MYGDQRSYNNLYAEYYSALSKHNIANEMSMYPIYINCNYLTSGMYNFRLTRSGDVYIQNKLGLTTDEVILGGKTGKFINGIFVEA